MSDIAAARPTAGAPIESTWGGQVHDLVEGIQAGFVDVTLTGAASGTVLVPFPRAYVTPPIVVVTGNSGGTAGLVAKTSATTPPTTAAFTAVVQHVAGTTGTWTVRVHWMAVGTPA